MRLDSKYLAELVAYEWASQTESVNTSALHFTKLLSYSQDIPVAVDTRNELLGQLNFDTIRIWHSEPEALINMQKEKYLPLIHWFNNTFKVIFSIFLLFYVVWPYTD